MKQYSNRFSVELMSKALGVSRSGYYKWLKTNRVKEGRLRLDEGIKAVFQDSKCRYGSPRVCEQLNKKGTDKKVSVATVARRMYVLGLVARPKRKYVHTTDSGHALSVSPNLLDRNFDVEEVNTVWVSDITYILTDEGWRYLTVILDLADRAVVSWILSQTMHAQCTVVPAFKQAIERRRVRPHSGLMFHSDRNCWDNAVAESFFKTIKTEELNRFKLIRATQLNSLIFKYIEGWYNTQRIHSTLRGLTPWEAFYEKTSRLAA